MKRDFQMIDVQKEYEQDILDTQIIWEQQEQLRYQQYLNEQEQIRQEMLRQQAEFRLKIEKDKTAMLDFEYGEIWFRASTSRSAPVRWNRKQRRTTPQMTAITR